MDQQTFRQAILLLSGENSVAILRALRDGDWHLSSEVARSLHIHITTASKFLQRFAELGLVDRKPHDARTFEYRLRSAHLRLEVDFEDDGGPLREVIDFYVAYFHSLFERIRYVGTPAIEIEMEHRLTTDHQELRKDVDALFALAAAQATLNDAKGGAQTLERLAEIEPNYPGLWTLKTKLHAQLGEAEKARQSRLRGQQSEPASANAASRRFQCPICEALVPADATTCATCGVKFEPSESMVSELDDFSLGAIQEMVQEELGGATKDERPTPKGPGKPVPRSAPRKGLTNGVALGSRAGSKTGKTNGLRGRTNELRGRTNGLTNGLRGRTNGLTNGVGRTNGLTNGLGHTNGITNGLGRTNGLTNGLA